MKSALTTQQGEAWLLSQRPATHYELPALVQTLDARDVITTPALQIATQELHRYAESTGKLPSSELITFTLQAYGVPLWGAELRAWPTAPTPSERIARAKLILSQRGQEDSSFPSYLGESIKDRGNRWRHLALSAPALLTLKSTSKQGAKLGAKQSDSPRVVFQLPAQLSAPKAILMDDSGALTQLPVHQENLSGWVVTLPPRDDRSAQELELLARSSFGLRPLVQLTFQSGPLTQRWSPPPAQPTPHHNAPIQVTREWLSRQVNATRARYRLPALTMDPHLNKIAQLHAQEMRDTAYFGHRSPRHGSPIKRLKSSGYVALKVGENIARNTTLLGAHRSLMYSLGHRQNMLDPEVTRLGIGVLWHQGAYLITQLYSLPATVYKVSDLPQLTESLYRVAQLSAPHQVNTCADHQPSALCSALLQTFTHLDSLSTNELPQPVTPDALLARSAHLLRDTEVTAWVAYSDALEAIEVPHNLLIEGSYLALKVRLYQPKSSRRPRLEVWGVSARARHPSPHP